MEARGGDSAADGAIAAAAASPASDRADASMPDDDAAWSMPDTSPSPKRKVLFMPMNSHVFAPNSLSLLEPIEVARPSILCRFALLAVSILKSTKRSSHLAVA